MAIPVEYAQHDGLDSLSVADHLQTFTFYAKGLGEIPTSAARVIDVVGGHLVRQGKRQ